MPTYSLHKIHQRHQFGFDPDDYSRFKFGDGVPARAFGAALAEGFIRDCLVRHPTPGQIVVAPGQIVVAPAPYAFLPPATVALKDHFVSRLNRWLADQGRPVVQETKIHRTITYKEDYGSLNAEERIRLIGNDTFHIDRSFVEGKTILFLDDIRITGGHERVILKMISECGITSPFSLLYFAELDPGAGLHPNIENFLNYYAVKSIFDLGPIINGADFRINTRIVKYILNAPPEEFRIFLLTQPEAFIEQLYDGAIGNGYHTIDAYRGNLAYIKEHIQSTTYGYK